MPCVLLTHPYVSRKTNQQTCCSDGKAGCGVERTGRAAGPVARRGAVRTFAGVQAGMRHAGDVSGVRLGLPPRASAQQHVFPHTDRIGRDN